MFNQNLLNYLVCPECKHKIVMQGSFLVCNNCHTKFDILDDIPVFVNQNNNDTHLEKQKDYFSKEKCIKTNDYKIKQWQKSYIKLFIKNFPYFVDKVIVDCGAGSGYMAIELAMKGAIVIASDLNIKSLLRLKKISQQLGLQNKLFCICCLAEKLPLKQNFAEIFISNAVLEHIQNEKQAITEINRVTKQESGLMITVPLSYKFINKFLLPVNYLHDKRIGHLRRYDKEILTEKFIGWNLINDYYTGHFIKVIKTLVNLFFPVFNTEKIENQDANEINDIKGASNIITFFKKNE